MAVSEEAPKDALGVAPAVTAGAARVGNGIEDVDTERVVEFEELVRDSLHGGPEAVTVWSVAAGSAGDAAEADPVELEPLSAGAEARIHEVRAVAEAGGGHELGGFLAQEGGENVHDSGEEMGAAGEGGGTDGFEEAAVGDVDVDEVVETIVGYHAGVVDDQEIDTDEHFEHVDVEVEIDR